MSASSVNLPPRLIESASAFGAVIVIADVVPGDRIATRAASQRRFDKLNLCLDGRQSERGTSDGAIGSRR